MNEGLENIFGSWWWSQKNYCVTCLLLWVFSFYLSMLGVIHIVKRKGTAITNRLKNCWCFLKREKQHLGWIRNPHYKSVSVTSVFIQYSPSLVGFIVGRERQVYNKRSKRSVVFFFFCYYCCCCCCYYYWHLRKKEVFCWARPVARLSQDCFSEVALGRTH